MVVAEAAAALVAVDLVAAVADSVAVAPREVGDGDPSLGFETTEVR